MVNLTEDFAKLYHITLDKWHFVSIGVPSSLRKRGIFSHEGPQALLLLFHFSIRTGMKLEKN